jgi:predicted metal-dependent peptidase
MLTQEERVMKAHITMMKHPETALYSGVMMMGTTEVIDTPVTAYTDGVNKRYGRAFLEKVCKDQLEVNGLVLHENLHISLRHMIHNRDLFEEDRSIANQAADYVVNSIINNLKDTRLAKLPEGGLYDPRFKDMSMREIYRILKEEQEEGGGGGKGDEGDDQGSGSGSPDKKNKDYEFDEHDTSGDMTIDQLKDANERIDRALREGALLAGRLGVDIPREITEILKPVVDWKEALRDFVSASCKGKDEYTWRKFNRRMLANDMYLPTVENETIGEVIVAIDTSGSIGQDQINEFASELVSICEAVEPDAVRILWWDTKVHGQQVFTENYANIGGMLKPQGGGGTKVSCVSEYINKHKLKAECVIVFTDGYLEHDVKWEISDPTLWMITDNKNWEVPSGKKVIFNR